MNTLGYHLYGQKTASGWGTPLNLKGTANVICSCWTTLDSAVLDTTFDGSGFLVGPIDAPQISQEILDQGVVNVYMMFLNDISAAVHKLCRVSRKCFDYFPRLNSKGM